MPLRLSGLGAFRYTSNVCWDRQRRVYTTAMAQQLDDHDRDYVHLVGD